MGIYCSDVTMDLSTTISWVLQKWDWSLFGNQGVSWLHTNSTYFDFFSLSFYIGLSEGKF